MPVPSSSLVRVLALAGVMAGLAQGCLFDASNPCGPKQRVDDRGFCVCEPGTRLDPAAASTCVVVPAALGVACDSASSPCKDAQFAHCQATEGTAGYCTRAGCGSTADCPDGYACDRTGAASYCRRPPRGQGKTCASHTECAGGEAAFCDNTYLKQCLVEGCRVGAPDACHEGWICCDLTPLALPRTLCLPAKNLPNGKCPAP